MNQSDQQPSESPFKQFFGDLWIKILPIFAVLKSVLLFLLKPFLYFGNFLKNLTASDAMLRAMVVIGIAAALVSALIEYQVVTEVYNSETEIVDIPFRAYKFLGQVFFGAQVLTDPSGLSKAYRFFGQILFGARVLTDSPPTQQESPKSPAPQLDQQTPPSETPEQDGIPKKSISWIPLLLVFALEGMKCSLIYYRYSRTESSGLEFTRFVRVVLIVFSACFTLIFLAQHLNKPNEDKITKQIEAVRKAIPEEMEKNDNELSELKVEEQRVLKDEEVLKQRMEKIMEAWKSGGSRGFDRLIDSMDQNRKVTSINAQIESTASKLEGVRLKIKKRRQDLSTDIETEKNRRITVITKEGRALDPEWMANFLSMLYGVWEPHASNYPRRFAIVFMVLFSILTSLALECIIIEGFKRFGKETAANQFEDSN